MKPLIYCIAACLTGTLALQGCSENGPVESPDFIRLDATSVAADKGGEILYSL